MPKDEKYQSLSEKDFIKKRKKLTGLLFEKALPNEYLVEIGKKEAIPVLGGKKLRFFKRFLRVPASVQVVYFSTDNANMNYQGLKIDGYACWRISSENLRSAITALDLFDIDDPMRKTNENLKTICTEAVRHLIANMSIEEALRNKDEIGRNLKKQLERVERTWGIIFDQVGIEKVLIQSNEVFNDLQAKFRDILRLDAEKSRLETDKNIAFEKAKYDEQTNLITIETEKKNRMLKATKETEIRDTEIEEQKKRISKERNFKEEEWEKDIAFEKRKNDEIKNERLQKINNKQEIFIKKLTSKIEVLKASKDKLQSENEVELLKTNLNSILDLLIAQKNSEVEKLRSEKNIEIKSKEEDFNFTVSLKNLEVKEKEKAIDTIITQNQLIRDFIERLPSIASEIKIDRYSILDSKGEKHALPNIISQIFTILEDFGLNFDNFINKGSDKETPAP